MTDAIKRIREALADGPTAGPWTVMPASAGEQCVARINAWESVPPNGVELAHDTIDAAFIAACHPEAISELLAERDALAVENERLRDLLRIEQDLALRNDPFRCQQIECEWFGRRVRAGDCQCHHLQATEHRAKVCKALDAARGKA